LVVTGRGRMDAFPPPKLKTPTCLILSPRHIVFPLFFRFPKTNDSR
jgi:hypothetical protein